MKKFLVFSTVLVLCNGFVHARGKITHTYYYELEDRRSTIRGKTNPYFGKKNHLLGTIHTHSIKELLPPSIQRHAKSHQVFLGEMDHTQISPRVMKKSVDYYALMKYGCRDPLDPDYLGMLSAKEQQELTRYVGFVYPRLVRSEGLKLPGGDVLKLSDFSLLGLIKLYNEGRQSAGMDGEICRCIPKALDLDDQANSYNLMVGSTGRAVDQWKTSSTKRYKDMVEVIKDILDRDSEKEIQRYYRLGLFEENITQEWLNLTSIKARNFAWLPIIISALRGNLDYLFATTLKVSQRKKNNILIAVGVGHLFGNYGLLKFLQKQGYRIKRATPKGVFRPYLPTLNKKQPLKNSKSSRKK